MRIEVLDEAVQDLIEGHRFYETRAQALGEYFLDSVYADIESLHLYAGVHSVHLGFHRLLTRRFPFAVYYRIQAQAIRIYAVLDCRRNPAWTRQRLQR